jgi:sulfur carrier protein ThiS adenylyltransferase
MALLDKREVEERLMMASVGIAGAGGLGSNIAMSLARAGVGHLLIVDFDVVEEKNLTRQYYFLDQVGELKVDALKANIDRAARGVRVDTLNFRLEGGKMAAPFKKVDVVVEALDNAATKAQFIEEVLLELPGKPIVAASGVAGWGGCEAVALRRMPPLYLIEDKHAKSSDEGLLLAPKVGLLAHMQANMVMEILLGVENAH